jgi:D-3-phosphoglycerate dehydrogenase
VKIYGNDIVDVDLMLMDVDTFAFIKPSAVLINMARGPIVWEKALIEVLQARRLAGAALDVFEVEPLPLDGPLMKMENGMLVPHNSNSGPAVCDRVPWNTFRNPGRVRHKI